MFKVRKPERIMKNELICYIKYVQVYLTKFLIKELHLIRLFISVHENSIDF
jgi:hypothetical protein